MTLRALSASQAERFDPEQVGGCKRRWYFQDVMRLEVLEPEESKQDGHAGHALFAMHYRGETLPKRHRMLKAVRGTLARGILPAREPSQLVESRFDGQPARDANGERVPLDTTRTLWLGGVPWDGYVDLRFYRAGMITVLDHKFSSDIRAYAKPADRLLSTVQMPVYALDSLRLWPEAQHVELVHHYVSRKGVDSFLRRQLVTVEQMRQRGREIERLVADMIAVSQAKSPDDVPGNRASCHTWSGCPFQSRCTAFKEKPKMDLNPEEQEWLSALGGGGAPPVKPNPDLDAFVEKVKAGGPVGEPAPLPEFLKEKLVTSGPEAAHATELEIASAAGALDPSEGLRRPASLNLTALPPDDNDPFAVFAPKSSVPAEQPARPPSCRDCGAELNAENGSQRDGVWKHIGCPAKSFAPAATDPKSQREDADNTTGGSGCEFCPHASHLPTPCTGRRGRGTCKCTPARVGEQMQAAKGVAKAMDEMDRARAAGHLPTCVQNDGGKWLCMEGCEASRPAMTPEEVGAAVRGEAPGPLTRKEAIERGADLSASDVSAILARERDMHRRTLGELEASQRGLLAARAELEQLRDMEQRGGGLASVGWTGKLQVNVDLGPETLALLTRIFGR